MKYGIFVLVAGSALLGPTITVFAAKPPPPCREHKDINASAASLEENLKRGGHVYKHVNERNGLTEAGKSQFDTAADFKAAWAQFLKLNKLKNPATCGTRGNDHDCVAASDVGIRAATVCDATDAKDKKSLGKCVSTSAIVPKAVGFWYLNSSAKPDKTGDGGTSGKWVLRTAYPSVNENCM